MIPVILCHFSKNDRSVDFNEGYGFCWLSWVMTMTKSSLFRPMIPSIHKVSIRIYCDFLMIYGKFTFLAITLDLIKIFEFCLNIWGLLRLHLCKGYLYL